MKIGDLVYIDSGRWYIITEVNENSADFKHIESTYIYRTVENEVWKKIILNIENYEET